VQGTPQHGTTIARTWLAGVGDNCRSKAWLSDEATSCNRAGEELTSLRLSSTPRGVGRVLLELFWAAETMLTMVAWRFTVRDRGCVSISLDDTRRLSPKRQTTAVCHLLPPM
jgi:hypothetical protein